MVFENKHKFDLNPLHLKNFILVLQNIKTISGNPKKIDIAFKYSNIFAFKN